MSTTIYGYVDSAGFVYPPTLGRDWEQESKESPHIRAITDVEEYKRLTEQVQKRDAAGPGYETLLEAESRANAEAAQRQSEQTTGVRTRTEAAKRAIKQV